MFPFIGYITRLFHSLECSHSIQHGIQSQHFFTYDFTFQHSYLHPWVYKPTTPFLFNIHLYPPSTNNQQFYYPFTHSNPPLNTSTYHPTILTTAPHHANPLPHPPFTTDPTQPQLQPQHLKQNHPSTQHELLANPLRRTPLLLHHHRRRAIARQPLVPPTLPRAKNRLHHHPNLPSSTLPPNARRRHTLRRRALGPRHQQRLYTSIAGKTPRVRSHPNPLRQRLLPRRGLAAQRTRSPGDDRGPTDAE